MARLPIRTELLPTEALMPVLGSVLETGFAMALNRYDPEQLPQSFCIEALRAANDTVRLKSGRLPQRDLNSQGATHLWFDEAGQKQLHLVLIGRDQALFEVRPMALDRAEEYRERLGNFFIPAPDEIITTINGLKYSSHESLGTRAGKHLLGMFLDVRRTFNNHTWRPD